MATGIFSALQRRVPMILVNGRLSENSYKRWRQLPGSIGNLLQRFDLCLAGTPGDSARFLELGAPRVITTGNLKLDVPAPSADPAQLTRLKDAINGRPVIAAAMCLFCSVLSSGEARAQLNDDTDEEVGEDEVTDAHVEHGEQSSHLEAARV